MSRDDVINKNIDFDLYRKTVYNYWNYIYCLTYLYINNENNFKMSGINYLIWILLGFLLWKRIMNKKVKIIMKEMMVKIKRSTIMKIILKKK